MADGRVVYGTHGVAAETVGVFEFNPGGRLVGQSIRDGCKTYLVSLLYGAWGVLLAFAAFQIYVFFSAAWYDRSQLSNIKRMRIEDFAFSTLLIVVGACFMVHGAMRYWFISWRNFTNYFPLLHIPCLQYI